MRRVMVDFRYSSMVAIIPCNADPNEIRIQNTMRTRIVSN
uniref:Uncharacterized protein n=1 Tax=Arundo donax TaxID=35708 RepID=A0A0A8ZQM8_ARUDO